MSRPNPCEEWWVIIARAHQEIWNLYDETPRADRWGEEDEPMSQPDSAHLDPVKSEWPLQTVQQ